MSNKRKRKGPGRSQQINRVSTIGLIVLPLTALLDVLLLGLKELAVPPLTRPVPTS